MPVESRQRIVYAATHAWSSPIRVGSHHIARTLVNHHPCNLLYLSHPITLASLLSRSDNQILDRILLWRNGPRQTEVQNLSEATCLMPFGPGPNLGFNSSFSTEHGWRLCAPRPSRFFKSINLDCPDQLWLDSFFQSYWVDLLQPKRLFVRVADHPKFIAKLSLPLKKAFREALDRAEHIITPTEEIAEFIRSWTATQIRVVPNGVDTAYFSKLTQPPIEYASDQRPKVLFVGAVAKWIDTALIKGAAALLPDCSFYVIGPSHAGVDMGHGPTNLQYLGARPYQEIAPYMQHADVGIAPFDVAKHAAFIESVDAIKIYEYLSARLPVVATAWKQTIDLAPFVQTTEQSPAAFAQGIREALRAPEFGPELTRMLKQVSWESRLASTLETTQSAYFASGTQAQTQT